MVSRVEPLIYESVPLGRPIALMRLRTWSDTTGISISKNLSLRLFRALDREVLL